MNGRINKNPITNKYIYFVLKIIYLVLYIKTTEENHRILINLSSEIHLVIKGDGNQSFLNTTFYIKPSLVYVNSIYTNSCKTFCEMDYEKNNIKLIFNEVIESCENMFYGLYNMIEIDLSNFDFSKVSNLMNMFRNCYNLEKINFGNINTSSVVNMKRLFHTCKTLTSINLINFDTSSVTDMEAMFYNCLNLLSIDLSNFNTKNLETMRLIFGNC